MPNSVLYPVWKRHLFQYLLPYMIVAWKFKKEIIQQSSHFIEIVTAQKKKTNKICSGGNAIKTFLMASWQSQVTSVSIIWKNHLNYSYLADWDRENEWSYMEVQFGRRRLRSNHPQIYWVFGFTAKTKKVAASSLPYLSLQIEDILQKRCGRAWVTRCTTSCWTTKHLISLWTSQLDKKTCASQKSLLFRTDINGGAQFVFEFTPTPHMQVHTHTYIHTGQCSAG